MTKRERARIAAEFGRMGGKSKSDAKVAASRLNGQKGGWPKGKKRKVKKGKYGKP